jgi:hypothetical protein
VRSGHFGQRQEVSEHALDDVLGLRHAALLGGRLGGKRLLAGACVSWWLLLKVSVLAGEGLCGCLTVSLVVYGKEKVYGSIP